MEQTPAYNYFRSFSTNVDSDQLRRIFKTPIKVLNSMQYKNYEGGGIFGEKMPNRGRYTKHY